MTMRSMERSASADMFRPPKSCGGVFEVHAPAQRVFDGARLLVDFLEHEVGILAALGIFGAEFEPADLDLGGVGAKVLHLEPLGGDGGDIIIVEVHHLPGVGDDRVGVAGQEMLAVADADDKGRASAGADHGVGLLGADGHEAVGPDDFTQCVADGRGQRLRVEFPRAVLQVMLADKMSQHFSIGAGTEGVPGFEQPFLEAIVVFDDAVVDDGDLAGLVEVRMEFSSEGGP